MYLQMLVIFVTLQLSVANQPVIFQKDNSVIAEEHLKASLPQHHRFIPVHYPYYRVITKQPVLPAVSPESDRLPDDLIEIAAEKLGIEDRNEIPSISELSELLGTTTREKTIDTIRQLTATESGIDLIKAFMESSDYTYSNPSKQPKYREGEIFVPSLPTSLLSETKQKDLELLQKIVTTPKPELGLFQRVASYLNFFDLFPQNKEIPISPVNKEVQQLKPNTHYRNHESRHQYPSKLQQPPVSDNPSNSLPVQISSAGTGSSTPSLPPQPHHNLVISRGTPAPRYWTKMDLVTTDPYLE